MAFNQGVEIGAFSRARISPVHRRIESTLQASAGLRNREPRAGGAGPGDGRLAANHTSDLGRHDPGGIPVRLSGRQPVDGRWKEILLAGDRGVWKPHIGGGTPRNFGPCGDVLDRNIPLLFRHFERRYNYLQPVTPPIEECLLVPFYVEGKAVGTIWAIAHDDRPGPASSTTKTGGSLSAWAGSRRPHIRSWSR